MPLDGIDAALVRADAQLQKASDEMNRAAAHWREVCDIARKRLQAHSDVPNLRTAVAEAEMWLDALQFHPRRLSSDQLYIARMRSRMAWRAYNAATQQVELKVAADPEVQQACKSAGVAWDALRRTKAAELQVRWTWEAREREIALAIRERRVVVGMTQAQAEQAMGTAGVVVSQNAASRILEWRNSPGFANSARTTTTHARIADSRVAEAWTGKPRH